MADLLAPAQIQAHLQLKNPSAETLAYLAILAKGVGAMVVSMTGQSFGYALKTKVLNPPARGNPVLVIPAPVANMVSLVVDKSTWQPVTDFNSNLAGYFMDKGRITTTYHAINKQWPIYPRTIVATYYEGYAQSQTSTIPSESPYTITPPTVAQQDLGVTIAGQPATLVTANPVVGQYMFANGIYTFAAADTGKTVAYQYAGTPPDVALAALQIAAGIFAAKDRLGVTSKSLVGQETVSFSNDAIPAEAKLILGNYKAFA